MANFAFDSSTVAPRETNFELLPAGNYAAQVTDSEIVDLKSGNGQAIKLTLTVLEQGYNGRKLFVRLNVRHTNPQAEQIGQQQLRELCDSIGVVRFNDTSELHNKPFIARVKVRKSDNPNYEDQNDVSGFKSISGGGAPQQMPAGSPAKAPAANASAAPAGTPPWAKKSA